MWFSRKFGIEIEVNAFDNATVKYNDKNLPMGIDTIAWWIAEAIQKRVEVKKWHHTHNNDCWVLKSDSSCGIEICSPPLVGYPGIKECGLVVETLSKDDRVKADSRCSYHIHIDASDLQSSQVNNVALNWTICESVFLDAMAPNRKGNKYCQPITSWDLTTYPVNKNIYENKYLTLNARSFFENTAGTNKRRTIEFRIMDNFACLSKEDCINWNKLILYFVYLFKDREISVSNLTILDPIEVFNLLKFLGKEPEFNLKETRNWFLRRLSENVTKYPNKDKYSNTFWSYNGRKRSIEQVELLCKDLL